MSQKKKNEGSKTKVEYKVVEINPKIGVPEHENVIVRKETAKEKKERLSKMKDQKMGIKMEKTVGIGDVVEKITKATGIKQAVEFFSDATGIDCGCDERKAKFNRISFKYGARVKIHRCPTKKEFEELDAIFARSRNRMLKADAARFAMIYSNIFGKKYDLWCPICAEIWRQKIREMKSVMAFYREEIAKAEIKPEQS